MTAAQIDRRPPPHPALYLILYLPFGISIGFVTVTLGWLLSHAGASVAAIASLAGAGLLANTCKVLWAPMVDTTLSAKRWYLIASAATAASIVVLSLMRLETDLLPVFGVLVFLSAFFATVASMAVERLMAFGTPEADKGKAGGWSQAGNLGGVGLGGGAGLWLAQHTGHPSIAGIVLAAACGVAALPLLWLSEPGRMAHGQGYSVVLRATGRDVVNLMRTRVGVLAGFLMVLPIGSGGLQQLWAAIAKDWGAGADEVALVGGLLSGLVSIPGAIAGGYLADRMDRKLAYSLFGVALSAVAVGMALAPRTPLAFMVFAGLYNLGVGFCYGAYSAVTLETIGQGAAATKFNLISSLSNAPILLVTLVDGWAEGRFGPTGMLYVEAAMGVAGVAVYYAVALGARGLGRAARVGSEA